jgi:DNA-binding transcriptional regulator YiaG
MMRISLIEPKKKRNKKMENLKETAFTLPEGWQEKLIDAPKITTYRPRGAFLRSLRKVLGIQQIDLSVELDVDTMTVSRWERDINQPQAFSQQEKMLEDWAWQIDMIQNVPPGQWESLLPVARLVRSPGIRGGSFRDYSS